MTSILDDLNHTELVVLAKLNDLPEASKAATRGDLIEALSSMQPVRVRSTIPKSAGKMSAWLIKWWDRFRDTVPKSCCPKCQGCSDIQVLDCFENNRESME